MSSRSLAFPVVLALAGIAAGLGAGWMLFRGEPHAGAHEAQAPKQMWTCGMHPQVLQDHPGECPICHMALTPVHDSGAAQAEAGPPVVELSPGLTQLMNVQTAPVERADLVRRVRTVGFLEHDHERQATVSLKVGGWVEKVHVHFVGAGIRRGQPLFDLYSPELIQTQQDLLSALSLRGRLAGEGHASDEARRHADDLVAAARQRMSLWDISTAQVERIEKSGKVSRVLTVTAPASGILVEQLDSLQGREVRPGETIYRIADVAHLWVSARIFEDELPWVHVGDTATLNLDALPGREFPAVVHAMQPTVDTATRTLGVTLGVDNAEGLLRQGMYVNAEFLPVAAQGALVVPSAAVLRTGERNVVVLARGEGRFQPREVVLGPESDGRVQVLEGLSEGEVVVTSAQFLIDAESSLKEALAKMTAQGAGHQGH